MALLKCIHLLGVILLFGNVLTWPFWIHRSRQAPEASQHLSFVHRTILATDKWFTYPGGAITVFTGTLMLMIGESRPATAWLLPKVVVFCFAFLLWRWVLVPATKRMETLAREAGGGLLPEAYGAVSRRWHFFGILDYALLFALLVWSIVVSAH